MHWTWIVWFTCGFISFLIIPTDKNSPESKGWERIKHFLFCFFLGGLTLMIAIHELREREKDIEKSKEEEKFKKNTSKEENKVELSDNEKKKKLEEIIKKYKK